MNKIYSNLLGIGFPTRYIQGPTALRRLKTILWDCLKVQSPLLIYDTALQRYLPLFKETGVDIHPIAFPGNCSDSIIESLTTEAKGTSADCILGFGGGKTLDTAKAVAANLNIPMVIMPSAASSDAPTSRLVAIYEAHLFKYSRVLPRNPDLVLVDTTILAEAPKRLLVAGIGDALSKKFEVEHAIANSVPNTFGMQSLLLSQTLANKCYELINEYAVDAISECESLKPGKSFEQLVEACILYSGLSFEGGGLSLAHGMLRGLTRLPETGKLLHGELVAYGGLVQVLACRQQRSLFHGLFNITKTVGLPTSLEQMGVASLSKNLLLEIAKKTLTAPYLEGGIQNISENDIVKAMLELENYSSQQLLGQQTRGEGK